MQTLTLEITDDHALKVLSDLAEKKYIRILEVSDTASPALSGKPLSIQEFKDWIAGRENGDTISLEEAKEAWAKQRKQLQSLVR